MAVEELIDIRKERSNLAIELEGGPAAAYLVDAGEYESVTGADLGPRETFFGKVAVGAFGHPVGDTAGAPPDAYLFSSSQLDLDVEHPDSYTDDFAEVLTEQASFRSFVDDYGPLRLGFTFDLTRDAFTVTMDLEGFDDDQVEESYQALQEVHAFEVEDLQQAEDVSATLDSVADTAVEPGPLTEDQELATVEKQSIRYKRGDTTGYLFNPEEPLAITIGGDALLFGEEDDWAEDSIDTVVEEFNNGRYSSGLLNVDSEALREEIDRRSEAFFTSFVEENLIENGEHSNYTTLKNFETLDEEVPPELASLRELEEDHDLSIDRDADRVKLQYLFGIGEVTTSVSVQQLADDLAEAVDADRAITVRRLRGLEENIGDIERAYLDWRGDYNRYSGAEEAVDDLVYNRQALERFCEEYGDRLEGNDGYFISALINDLDVDRVELPDMEGVDHLGMENDGTEIVIDGDAGTKLGYGMQDGRIEVKGSIRYYRSCPSDDCEEDYHVRTGSAGKEMEGGEIYIHGNVDSFYSDGNDIFTKEEHWLRDDTWQKV